MTNPTRAKQSSIIPADLKIPRQGKGRRFGRNQEIQEKLAGRLEQKLAMMNEAKKNGASSKVSAKVTAKTAKFASVMQGAECEPPVAMIVIKKDSLDHFLVKVMPDTAATADTVAFAEGAKLFILAKDSKDADINFDTNSLLKLSLLTNEDYGTFIDCNNDTLITAPAVLENVRYGDAKDGRIKFAAIKKNPDSIVTCRIRVELQNDAAKKGDTAVIVLEQTLKIVMNAPYVVRPSIPTEDSDTNMTKLRKKSFEIRMTRNKLAVPNHAFRLTTNYIDNAGGHEHGDTRNARRVVNDDNFGYFTVGRAEEHRRPLDDVTGADGKFSADYNASIFGDSMKIYLKSKDPKKEKYFRDSVKIVEKVEGLIDFRNIASNSRWIIAQTATGRARHPDNNWCAPEFSDSIQSAIAKFYNWSLSEIGGGTAIAVSLNDMSLIFGGRFDISGRWDGRQSQQHRFHRVGTSVDLNQTLSVIQLRELTLILHRSGLERNAERPEIHYGSNGGN